MIISLSAGDPGIPAWVMMAGDRFNIPIGGGCTAVSAPQFYPYLGTGQMVGLLGGLKGAADYETMVRLEEDNAAPGTATPGHGRPVRGAPCNNAVHYYRQRGLYFDQREEGRAEMNWEVIGIWLGALLSLSLYSFLYKDNPFYKFAEHLFVGMSAGYWVIYTIMNVLVPNWWQNMVPTAGGFQPIWVIPGVLGLFMLFRLIPKLAGYSRLSLALIVGTGAGLSMTAMLQTNALPRCMER